MRHELSDYEWTAIKPMLPNKPRCVRRINDRRVLNGIFWILSSGAPWRDLPRTYGPRTTCYNRFVRWRRAGVWDQVMDALAADHDAAVQMIDTSVVRVHRVRGRPASEPDADRISKKSPGRCRGFHARFRIKSVAADRRSAELVVQARGEEIDVLLDMVGDQEAGRRIDVPVAHEEVIVFEAERRVRSEGVFDAGCASGSNSNCAKDRATLIAALTVPIAPTRPRKLPCYARALGVDIATGDGGGKIPCCKQTVLT